MMQISILFLYFKCNYLPVYFEHILNLKKKENGCKIKLIILWYIEKLYKKCIKEKIWWIIVL
jgi:hypothetical protein